MRFRRFPTIARAATVVVAVAGLILPGQAAAAASDARPAAAVAPAAASSAVELSTVATSAAEIEHELRAALADRFAGAWLPADSQTLMVGVTTSAAAERVRSAGAEPRLMRHSLSELDAIKQRLDRSEPPPESVTGWYVDVQANAVVVEALAGAEPTAAEFIETSGVADAPVRIAAAVGPPRLTMYPLREGDPFFTGGSRCSIGFLVRTADDQTGFLTAGHCGTAGTPTRGFNGAPQGVFDFSLFPGRDVSLVIVNDDWVPDPITRGRTEAPIGTTVCRIGSTTGTHCGFIMAKNQTVNYPQGTVFGLTRTNVCAEPGDSGGPFLSANLHGQGITSGGSGNCSFGGVTFFQPLNPVLSMFNLTLITA